MDTKTAREALEQLPVKEVERSLNNFLKPLLDKIPDKRLRDGVCLAVQGIIASESPIILRMAQGVERTTSGVWAAAKRMYGMLKNKRYTNADVQDGMATIARQSVEQEQVAYLVVVVDPVNFEKPYTEKLEGVSTVHKSTPPDRSGKARLTPGYPSITASVVNTRIPVTTYANWFSYTTDFVSENVEIQKSFDATTALFPDYRIRYVTDAGLDDQRWFAALQKQEFIIRASHMERLVEVYNERLGRWEGETLGDLVAVTSFTHTFFPTFTHARKTRTATVKIGWYALRLPQTHQLLWAIIAYEEKLNRTLVLLTNIPLHSIAQVRSVYNDWRLRTRIEHGYRFDQEQGLDVEDMRLHTLDRMQRLFLLVLLSAQFVFFLNDTWPAPAVTWFRSLGGKLHLKNDLDGPYLLLRGLSALFKTLVTISHSVVYPFPFPLLTYG